MGYSALYLVHANSWASRLVPGDCFINWLQGNAKTSKPGIANNHYQEIPIKSERESADKLNLQRNKQIQMKAEDNNTSLKKIFEAFWYRRQTVVSVLAVKLSQLGVVHISITTVV